MYLYTQVDLLLKNLEVSNTDQSNILSEFRRFLTHESTGVTGYDRMPPEWTELTQIVATGGTLSNKTPAVKPVMEAWYQEIRDLILILSRETETAVTEKISRRYLSDMNLRFADDLDSLIRDRKLSASLVIPDARYQTRSCNCWGG